MPYDLYVAGRGDRCRYVLGRAGRRMLVVVGLNPSTATREKGDPTVTKVERIARRSGFDGFVLVNLYPLRATDLRALPARADRHAYRRNLSLIRAHLARLRRPTIWVAWGADVGTRHYLAAAARALLTTPRHGARWLRFGPLTRSGHPRHPSRAPYRFHLEDFDVEAYRERLE
jgi:hypothetical protein